MKEMENRLDEAEELFDRADGDGDDHISLTEFRGLMLELDRTHNGSAVARHVLEIDTNRDGRIGFADFRAW